MQIIRTYVVFGLVLIVAACGGGSGGTPAPNSEPLPTGDVNSSPGGFWIGTDTDGGIAVALADENGVFYFLDGRFDNGTGLLTVTNSDNIYGLFRLPDEPGVPDQTPDSDCRLSGTVVERQSLTLDAACRASPEQSVETTLTLDYDARYERGSSLDMIAGNYSYEISNIPNIAADGAIFGQDGVTGCIASGQVNLIDGEFNAYDIELRFESCTNIDNALNFKTFFGRAMLDDTEVPERLIIALSGSAEGTFRSFATVADRL